jgi:amino acid permease
MLGSVSIAVNTLTGPAMLGIPALFARSGIIPTCSTVLFVSFLCAFCSLHISNTISKVPGNLTFKKEVEYSEAFRFFWGNAWYNFTQGVFFCCISCLNISSIVDTAQVVDTFLGHWWPWGGTAALELSGGNLSVIRWDYSVCSDLEMRDGSCSPFNKAAGLHFTAGNLVVTVLFLPLARMDLKENAAWQVVAFLILLLTSVQFVVTFIVSGLNFSQVSLWGEDYDDLFGVVLFNFALVVAIPAWLYEREPDVDVPTVIHGSCALSSILYILIGILGHVAIPNVSDNMLQSMMSGSLGTCLQLGASIFAFAIVGLGIPLFSVLTRLNLVGSGLCSERVGNLFAVYFPFAVSWFLYDGDTVTKLLSW